ncbi:hypothetical protein [Cryptosporangium sp. NPDC051539]|uniref:hypothetical protein n=1 Tax=Cryptosporangium sp. NPDC051539 TaxID=3363962 RepID=UPI003789152D
MQPANDPGDLETFLHSYLNPVPAPAPATPAAPAAPAAPIPWPGRDFPLAAHATGAPQFGDAVTVAQQHAVNGFLAAHPRFWPNIQMCLSTVVWGSKWTKDWGGFVYYHTYQDAMVQFNQELHVRSEPETAPQNFLRLFLHETGHACFERLLRHDLSISPVVAQHVPPHRVQASYEITMIGDLPPAARLFYDAWMELKHDNGAGFCCLDLGADRTNGRMSPAQRRKYQADDFSEFCAEMFMMYAMGDLPTFMKGLEPDTADSRAWVSALAVLDFWAKPILTLDCTTPFVLLAPRSRPRRTKPQDLNELS